MYMYAETMAASACCSVTHGLSAPGTAGRTAVQAEQGLNMSARFKDSKIEKLEKAMRAGHVDNPGDVICDTIESLKGALLKHESKETALKVRAAYTAPPIRRLQPEGSAGMQRVYAGLGAVMRIRSCRRAADVQPRVRARCRPK